AAALQVNKIKNRVLKLTGAVQRNKIRIAQPATAAAGTDTSSLGDRAVSVVLFIQRCPFPAPLPLPLALDAGLAVPLRVRRFHRHPFSVRHPHTVPAPLLDSSAAHVPTPLSFE
ncbi:hypothetical protein C8R44DRAFT_641760, partial [Mycena epipterygia]